MKNKSIFWIYILIIVLLVGLLIVLFIGFDIKGYIEKMTEKPKLLVIKDDCIVILNNLAHSMKNADECAIKCKNECNIQKMDFLSSNFSINPNLCYNCNCYCK